MELKDKIKKLRHEKNLSQNELAEKIFVSRSAVAKWENGLGIPSDDSLERLCQLFEIEKEFLTENIESQKNIIIKNKSILKMKIIIIVLSSLLLMVISIASLLGILFHPRALRTYFENDFSDLKSVEIVNYNNDTFLIEKNDMEMLFNDLNDLKIIPDYFDTKKYKSSFYVVLEFTSSKYILDGYSLTNGKKKVNFQPYNGSVYEVVTNYTRID